MTTAREQFVNNVSTTLNGTINNSVTSLVVTSATGFPSSGNFRIIIDSEILLVTAVSGTTFTVTRGAESSSAASHSSGATVAQILTKASLLQAVWDSTASLCEGRLTLTTVTPVTVSDVTGATNVYFTPYNGNHIALYTSTSTWVVRTFSEITLALGTLSSGKPYDVFAYDNSGTVALDSPLAWTNTTTRATALVLQDGVLVKSGDATRRYLGTFYTTATTTTEDSQAKRFLYNYYNKVRRQVSRQESATSWTVNTSGAWRQANANSANRVEAVIGWPDVLMDLAVLVIASNATNQDGYGVGIGEDSTTVNASNCYGLCSAAQGAGNAGSTCSKYSNMMSTVGYHAWNWLEQSEANSTFFGTRAHSGSQNQILSGLIGYIEG